jgi:ATP-dependent Zn protease
MIKKLIVAGGLILLAVIVWVVFYSTRSSLVDDLEYSELRRAMDGGNVKSVVIEGTVVRGRYVVKEQEREFVTEIPEGTAGGMAEAMYSKGIAISIEHRVAWCNIMVVISIIAVAGMLALCVARGWMAKRAGPRDLKN